MEGLVQSGKQDRALRRRLGGGDEQAVVAAAVGSGHRGAGPPAQPVGLQPLEPAGAFEVLRDLAIDLNHKVVLLPAKSAVQRNDDFRAGECSRYERPLFLEAGSTRSEGSRCPHGGSHCPRWGNRCPHKGSTVPDEGNDCPYEGSDCLQKGNDCPRLGNEIPHEGNNCPNGGNRCPNEGNGCPRGGNGCPFFGPHWRSGVR